MNQILTDYINGGRMSCAYIGITVDGICHRSASSGRAFSTSEVDTKESKVPKILIWHA